MRSYYLVFAQLVLTLWLLIPGVLSRCNSAGMVLMIAGAALGLWALSTNRLGNFRILPEIKQGAHLVKSGPYRWVCHPMYTALLLVTLGSLICKFTGLRLAAWLGLVAVLCAKALREERLLRVQFSEYTAYRAHTGRFLPWL